MLLKRSGILAAVLVILLSGYFISAYYNSNDTGSLTSDSSRHSGTVAFSIPDHLTFAGETVPLNDPDLRERYDRELTSNAYFHSNTILLMKRSGRWFPLMKPILEKYVIPTDFLYLPLIESGLTNMVSPRKAVGYWQLTEASAKELGLVINSEIDERYNPIRSTEAACFFLRRAKEKFGTWTNAAAAYNMGMRGLARSMEMQKMDSYYDLLLNEETSRYIFRILATKEIFEHPRKFGFLLDENQYYNPESLRDIQVNSTIPDLAEFAIEHGINYKLLKRYNPWLRTNRLTVNNPEQTWIIQIPVDHPVYHKAAAPVIDSLLIGDDRYDPSE